jgi:hypothetical protein
MIAFKWLLVYAVVVIVVILFVVAASVLNEDRDREKTKELK